MNPNSTPNRSILNGAILILVYLTAPSDPQQRGRGDAGRLFIQLAPSAQVLNLCIHQCTSLSNK